MSEAITKLRCIERALDGETRVENVKKQGEFVWTEADDCV